MMKAFKELWNGFTSWSHFFLTDFIDKSHAIINSVPSSQWFSVVFDYTINSLDRSENQPFYDFIIVTGGVTVEICYQKVFYMGEFLNDDKANDYHFQTLTENPPKLNNTYFYHASMYF